MPFRLRIQSEEEVGDGQDRLFYLPEINIGSAPGNELVLKDTQRVVSRKHARIYQEGSAYLLEDTRSRNGTTLNGKPVAPMSGIPLSDGDQVRIGPYLLAFFATFDETGEIRTSQPAEGATVAIVDVVRLANDVSAELRRAYKEHADSPEDARKDALTAILQNTLSNPQLDARTRADLLRLIRERFPNRSYELVRLQRKLDTVDVVQQLDVPANSLHRTAFESLRALQMRLDPGSTLLSDADVQKFGDLLEASLAIFIDVVFQLVQAREQLQREFDVVQNTQISTTNRLKASASPQDLSKYLFGLTGGDMPAERSAMLKDATDGVTVHQLAIMAGFQESIRAGYLWVLQELAPPNFEAGGKSLFGGKGNWESYVKRHRELSNEDQKRIQREFMVGFARGYEKHVAELKRMKGSQPPAKRGAR